VDRERIEHVGEEYSAARRGLNTVLALAGAPVTAKRARVSRLHIGASLRANDSLTDSQIALLRGDQPAARCDGSGSQRARGLVSAG